MSARRLLVVAMLVALSAVAGCHGDGPRPGGGPHAVHAGRRGTAFFTTPKDAVGEITVMLRAKDWPRLARYYDLTGTAIERKGLVSGEFFYRDRRPAAGHPAGFWRYKHPFAPGFTFHHQEQTAVPNVVEVVLTVEIDQGGGMVQRGLSRFRMVRHPRGWQVLPPPPGP